MSNELMRAIVVGTSGAELADVPKPAAGKGQVLVKVRASCLNRADSAVPLVRAAEAFARMARNPHLGKIVLVGGA